MVWFSERKELEKQYYEWIKENGIADQPNSVVAFLEINGLLNDKKVHEKAGIVKVKKTNFDLITESAEAFADWIFESYTNVPETVPCTDENCETTDRMDCKKCFIKWLQKECEQ